MFDSFYYDANNAGQGGNSFHLDDDTGWYNTAFSAGADGSGATGVDFFSSTANANSPTNNLVMFWR